MSARENLYYEEVFTLGPSFKTNFSVSLTSNSIIYESELTKNQQRINIEDVIGAKFSSSGSTDAVQNAFVHIYSYPLKKKRFSKVARRVRHEYVFAVSGRGSSDDNLEIAKKWVKCIRWLLAKDCDPNLASKQEDYAPKQQFLIFINPFGGKGTAMKLFEKKVKPMLQEADVDFNLKVTEHMGHAKEIIQNMEVLTKFDCIVCCSGDGIINEVINGLMSRPDWREAIKTPIGHIPCGSGNGLCATSLYHSGEPFDMISSVFTIITGEALPLDILKAQTLKSEAHHSFLSIVFGIVADVDIESEKYRYMGDMRFNVLGLKKILEKQLFSSKLWYLPADNDSSLDICRKSKSESKPHHSNDDEVVEDATGTVKTREGSEDQGNLEDGKLEIADGNLNNGILDDGILENSKSDTPAGDGMSDVPLNGEDSNVENGSLRDGKLDDCSSSDGVLGNSTFSHNLILPDFHEPIPETWKVIEGDFVGLLFVSTSHIGRDAVCAREATFGDGIIYCLCLNASMSRSDLINVLAKLETGDVESVHGVDMLKARAFRIEPSLPQSKAITIDGERFECGKTQAEVYRGLGRVRCRRPANQ